MNEQIDTESSPSESTYTLLVRSEEKNRNALEMTIYPLLIVSVILAIAQFAQQPVGFASKQPRFTEFGGKPGLTFTTNPVNPL